MVMPDAGMAGRLSGKAPHSKGAAGTGQISSGELESAFQIDKWLRCQGMSWTVVGNAPRTVPIDLAKNKWF